MSEPILLHTQQRQSDNFARTHCLDDGELCPAGSNKCTNPGPGDKKGMRASTIESPPQLLKLTCTGQRFHLECNWVCHVSKPRLRQRADNRFAGLS